MPRLSPTTVRRLGAIACAASALLFARCASRCPGPLADDVVADDAIIVGGERFSIGTRVVTWHEPDGYSAYRLGKHFDREAPPDGKKRYSTRGHLPAEMQERADALTLEDLQQVVHQFVVHYDVCGTSRQCFKVLQDVRTLSVHFLLDVDGTIYQTLDLRERAWHATIANDFSVGIEIAHPGARAQPLGAEMRTWYEQDELGWRMKFPKWMKETGVRTEGFVPRPDRPELVSGTVQGKTFHQFDFTKEQYEALPKLIAGLHCALPRIRLEAPRNPDGTVVDHVLPEDELRAFDGVVGHFHVQKNKQDPGPAFQWDRVLREAQAEFDR